MIHRLKVLSALSVPSLVGAILVGLVALGWNSGATRGEVAHYSASELAEILAEGADPDVHSSLADGLVTSEEYEASMTRAVKCMEERGIAARLVPGQAVGGGSGLVAEFPITSDQGELNRAMAACIDRHSSSIGRVWAEQNKPSSQETEAMLLQVAKCFTASGRADLAGARVFETAQRYGPDSPEVRIVLECWHRAQTIR